VGGCRAACGRWRAILVLRLDHGAYALATAGLGAGAVGAAGDDVFFGQRIVGNELAANFVEAALDPGAVEELGLFGLGIVLDAFAFAFDVFVLASRFCRKRGRCAGGAGGDAALVAVVVLADDDALGADDQRALDQLHVAFEGLHLLHVIDRDAVGLDIDRLVAVGLFGAAGTAASMAQAMPAMRRVRKEWRFMVSRSGCDGGCR
jgi:hypothetical protein